MLRPTCFFLFCLSLLWLPSFLSIVNCDPYFSVGKIVFSCCVIFTLLLFHLISSIVCPCVFSPYQPSPCRSLHAVQDSKFRLILIESRVHRIARYYKKVLACASELGLYVSVFRVLLRIFGWGFRFWFWRFCVSAQALCWDAFRRSIRVFLCIIHNHAIHSSHCFYCYSLHPPCRCHRGTTSHS